MKNIILLVLFLLNVTCFSLVKTSEPACKFSKTEITDNLINLIYMNCYTYLGENSMQHGVVYYPNSNTPTYGISKIRGNYEIKIENKKTKDCIKGDCVDGEGVEQFYHSEKDIFLWKKEDKMITFTNYFGNFTFKGTFKNYLKYNGVLTDEKGKILAKYENGKETPTDYFYEKVKTIKNETLKKEEKDISDYYDKLDRESRQRQVEYSKNEKEELSKFINKMFTIGARDFYSCYRLCQKYGITYDCNSKCRDSMNINSSSSTPSFSTSPPINFYYLHGGGGYSY